MKAIHAVWHIVERLQDIAGLSASQCELHLLHGLVNLTLHNFQATPTRLAHFREGAREG